MTVGASPNEWDVLVACFLNFIRPVREQSSIHRARFMETILTALSVYGLFERMVTRGCWEYAVLPLEHYPFDAMNITPSQALLWLYPHAIELNSPELAALHSYAVSWRNFREKRGRPEGEQFQNSPRSF
ncbi:hypothetical protein DFH09DRAFT_1323403 [Mycena vulgaris]|nr:hypothetical protein DFH09DRAFT_1323403 [Mycena vulgaris]